MPVDLKTLIRTIPDYPKPGIMFRDITTLIENPDGFREAIERSASHHRGMGITHVAGIEARGFIFGAAVAISLGVGFVPIRKRGKLPGETIGQNYALEYGVDTIEMHADAVDEGDRVLLVDDLIATGGTAIAAVQASAPDRRAGGPFELRHRPARTWRCRKAQGASMSRCTRWCRSQGIRTAAPAAASARGQQSVRALGNVHDMYPTPNRIREQIMPDYITTPHSYSVAVRAGDFIFLGLHRGGGEDSATQLAGTMAGLEKTLGALGRPLASLVQVRVHLRHITDLAVMEKLFAPYFETGRYPARMSVTTEFHDADCLVMIEGIATARDGL